MNKTGMSISVSIPHPVRPCDFYEKLGQLRGFLCDHHFPGLIGSDFYRLEHVLCLEVDGHDLTSSDE